MEPFEYKGHWWLPENSDHRIAGILRFDGIELAKLELFGKFSDGYSQDSNQTTIYGVVPGKYVTLLNCLLVQENFNHATGVESLVFTDYLAHFAFIGASFVDINADYFESMSVDYFNLSEWTAASGKMWQAQRSVDGLEIMNRPEELKATISDVTISIRHYFSGNNSFAEQSVTHRTSVIIEPTELQLFHSLSDVQHKLSLFFSLAIGQATYPLSISVRSESSHVSTSVFYAPNVDLVAQREKPNNYLAMLFNSQDIFDSFEACLQNWISKAENLSPVYELYAATLFRPVVYLHQKFLNLVQALETYHRRVIAKDGNLEDRLKKILHSHQDNFPIFAAHINIDDFAFTVTRARNWYTHYDKKNSKYELKGAVFFYIVQYLRLTIEICLLQELGLPKTKVDELVERAMKNRFEDRWFDDIANSLSSRS